MKSRMVLSVIFLVILSALRGFGQVTSPEAREKSWQRHLQMKAECPFNSLAWRAVGPAFCGGRIQSIAVHPRRPYEIYLGVGSGNIWKTVNNGVTWEPIFEHESTFAIGEIAISPSNPDIIWVGTGEILMARSSYAGTGVFKSIDAGKTWTPMGLRDSHHIGRVLIDPKNPDLVYVAAIGHNFSRNTERGLFKTTDGGKTWTKILYFADNIAVIDAEIDPTNRNIIYAAAWERDRKPWGHVPAGEGSGLFKSVNAGKTWKKLTVGLPSGKDLGRIGVEIAPSNPKVLYVLLDNEALRPEGSGGQDRPPQSIRGEVYRSDDRGETWRKVNRDYLQANIGYDWNLLQISPNNENEVYVAGNRFLISKDGGATYRQVEGTIVPLLAKDKRQFPLDQHALWIDPQNPDRILLGNDHGFYVSYDRAATWFHINNIPITEFYAVAVDMETPYNIYGGNQDNAAVVGPSDAKMEFGLPDPWRHVYLDSWGGGDGFVTLPDPTEKDKIYYFTGPTVFLKDMKTGKQMNVTPKRQGGEANLRNNWMVPFIISPHDTKTLYYGLNKLFQSTDQGTNWTAISPDLSTDPEPDRRGNIPYGTLTSVSESPLQPGLIYAGTDDGHVQVTRDGGKTWTLITKGLPSKWVSRVTAGRFEPGTVCVSFTGFREDDFKSYLFLSRDYGQTWTSISAGLPAESVNVVQEDPTASGILYIGTDLGVYASLDFGKTWLSLCSNLPSCAVYDLVIHPRDGELVIGTHGRSIFVLDVKPIRAIRPKG
jgi:photosystem II stability/assembly factor-like uncharacterized protein